MTVMKWRISEQRYKHLTKFSRFVLFEPAASTMRKINPVDRFNLVTDGLFIYIYLLLSEKIIKIGFSYLQNFSNDFALFS